MYTEYTWALKSLQEDMNSRQAVMHFNKPSHQWDGNKDFVCTMYASFLIRNNKLRMSVKMRSNDVMLGMPTDIAFFTTLQQQMLNHLRKTSYPDLEIGTYSHVVDSMHIYKRDFEKALDMLHYSFENVQMPVLDNDLIDTNGLPTDVLKKLELLHEFNDLEEYTEFLEWQRGAGIRCPVLYVQNTYDAQGNRVYKVRPSVTELEGGLPPTTTVPLPLKFTPLVDATETSY